jgi:hypothetical protein
MKSRIHCGDAPWQAAELMGLEFFMFNPSYGCRNFF